MSLLSLVNARVFDGLSADLLEDAVVVVEDGRIREVSTGQPPAASDAVLDCHGQVVMPGLIDAHVHAYAMEVNLNTNDQRPMTLIAHRAHAMLNRALMRGFTTVRDCGGADHGLWLALEQGWIQGPRLFYCGRMLSQTGGHGDFRHPHAHDAGDFCWSCGCERAGHVAQLVDGDTEVRRAVRDTLRHGASFIKFAASGGVTSIGGSVTAQQFSDAEISAIVDEVVRAEAYCTAHIHPDAAIQRAVALGVHCIEHASMIEPDTARMVADAGVFLVPTLSVVTVIDRYGKELGYAPESLAKLKPVKQKMYQGLEAMRAAGAAVGFGTDLLGPLEEHQGLEFLERAEIYTPAEVLRQATSVNARILRREGQLGVVAPGALADLLVVRENPLENLAVFSQQGQGLAAILKNGQIIKNEL